MFKFLFLFFINTLVRFCVCFPHLLSLSPSDSLLLFLFFFCRWRVVKKGVKNRGERFKNDHFSPFLALLPPHLSTYCVPASIILFISYCTSCVYWRIFLSFFSEILWFFMEKKEWKKVVERRRAGPPAWTGGTLLPPSLSLGHVLCGVLVCEK